jgi:iron complex transport system permease protein
VRVMASSVGRLVLLLVFCIIASAVLAGLFLSRGEPSVSLGYAIQAALGQLEDGRPAAFVIFELRGPRVILALVAGAAMALAGAIMQDALRNPIADPGLLGISGAAAFVVATAVAFPALLPSSSTPFLALLAGLATGALLVLLAGSVRDPVKLILIGVVLTGLYTTLTAVVMLLAPRGTNLAAFFTYTVGSLASATWDRLWMVLPWVAVAIPVALVSGRTLNLLQLGDDMATGLGMNVARARFLLLGVAVFLVAPVVSVVGPIAFVAFLSPHITRRVIASHNAWLVLPGSAAVGAVVVLAADTVGRLAFFPLEIPAGIWTILIAGPIAIWLAGTSLRGTETEAAK